jgi:hypothetical protein
MFNKCIGNLFVNDKTYNVEGFTGTLLPVSLIKNQSSPMMREASPVLSYLKLSVTEAKLGVFSMNFMCEDGAFGSELDLSAYTGTALGNGVKRCWDTRTVDCCVWGGGQPGTEVWVYVKGDAGATLPVGVTPTNDKLLHITGLDSTPVMSNCVDLGSVVFGDDLAVNAFGTADAKFVSVVHGAVDDVVSVAM